MNFTVVGVPNSVEIVQFLESGQDPCFGKLYAKTTTECFACRAPVVFEGKLHLMRELCAMACAGKQTVDALVPLSSKQVLERLERGATPAEIFREILASADPKQSASTARQLLVDRLWYLKSQLKMDVPEVPRTKELLKDGR